MKLLSERHGGELRLMVQCLELYYRQGRSQKDIAVALGVSAATVSRLLKRAMDDGLVRVELDLPATGERGPGLGRRTGRAGRGGGGRAGPATRGPGWGARAPAPSGRS